MANRLHVGGLSFDTTDEELKTFFQQAGAVQSATVISEKFSGRSMGFGFVKMSNHTGARQALSQLNGKMLGERAIKVREGTSLTFGQRSRRSLGRF